MRTHGTIDATEIGYEADKDLPEMEVCLAVYDIDDQSEFSLPLRNAAVDLYMSVEVAEKLHDQLGAMLQDVNRAVPQPDGADRPFVRTGDQIRESKKREDELEAEERNRQRIENDNPNAAPHLGDHR